MASKEEIYDSLDAPVIVWEKIHTTNDLSYLLVKRRKPDDKLMGRLIEAWEKMYDEFIEEFGFSDSFVSMKMKEVEIARLKCKLIQTEDRSYETDIEIAEIELEDMKKDSTGGTDFSEQKIAIEKNMGFQINMHTTSIREFYKYINTLK